MSGTCSDCWASAVKEVRATFPDDARVDEICSLIVEWVHRISDEGHE